MSSWTASADRVSEQEHTRLCIELRKTTIKISEFRINNKSIFMRSHPIIPTPTPKFPPHHSPTQPHHSHTQPQGYEHQERVTSKAVVRNPRRMFVTLIFQLILLCTDVRNPPRMFVTLREQGYEHPLFVTLGPVLDFDFGTMVLSICLRAPKIRTLITHGCSLRHPPQ